MSTVELSALPARLPQVASTKTPPWSAISAAACVSLLAYGDSQDIQSQASEWSCDIRAVDVAEFDVQVLLVRSATEAWVAYRGTQPDKLRDWLDDLDCAHEGFVWGSQVHSGFRDAMMSAWAPVHAFVKDCKAASFPVWLGGHSLGAAMTTLAAAELFQAGLVPDGVANFGAPRAGDETFAKAYDGRLGDRTWRVINNADIVTRVPPRALGYQHVGRAIHFDTAGRPRIESGSWNHFLDTLSGPIKDLLVWGAEGLADHSMGKYLSLVLAADSSSEHN